MDLADLLYWESVSDLASDDFGTWEIAWRANTLAGGRREPALAAATAVIRRLVEEGLAIPVDESGERCGEARLNEVLAGDAWARASRPTPMLQLRAVADAVAQRLAEMPPEAIEALSTSWKAGLSGDIPAP